MVDAGFSVEFGPTTCTVNQGGTRSNLGQRVGNLYYLNKELVSNTESFTEVAELGLSTNQSPIATIETWHKRLGHRTLDATGIAYITPKVANMEIRGAGKPTPTICGICAIGRQHKEAGTKTREKAKELLEVVHSDVCGPMQTPGLSGERYFVTFIDEKSGRVSVALLKSKDGVLREFKSYRARAEKSSGRDIKTLRSDGGGEFLNNEFRRYLLEAGIQHTVSPPYSPSQNGVAERQTPSDVATR